MSHFDKFIEIYCDKSFKLREDTYLVQEYESKSEESFFNYLVKQKIKQRILESIESINLIPSQLLDLFSYVEQKKYSQERGKFQNDISQKNKFLEKILTNLQSLTKNFENDYTEDIKSIGKESINDTFQEKYSDYFNTVNKAKRTRQKVIDYLRKYDCFLGIFYVLIWGGHRLNQILDVLNHFEDDKQFLNDITSMLCKASHSPEEVYSTLKSIKGLGPAYFTKILYFYTHAFNKNRNHKAYIMDQFTSKSMNLLRKESIKSGINLSQDDLEISKNTNKKTGKISYTLDNNTPYSMYENYNQDIERLVQFFQEKGNRNVDADIIEVMLFGDSNKKSNTPLRKWRLYTNQAYPKEF